MRVLHIKMVDGLWQVLYTVGDSFDYNAEAANSLVYELNRKIVLDDLDCQALTLQVEAGDYAFLMAKDGMVYAYQP